MRSFIAIDIPPDVLPIIEEDSLWSDSCIRKVHELHLTLLFLGEVQEQALGKLFAGMDGIASKFSRFRAEIGGAGAFPSPSRPTVIWLGFNDNGATNALNSELKAMCRDAGVSLDDGPFTPHITVARVRCRPDQKLLSEFMGRWKSKKVCTFEVGEMLFKKSTLMPGGAVHEVMHRSPFLDHV